MTVCKLMSALLAASALAGAAETAKKPFLAYNEDDSHYYYNESRMNHEGFRKYLDDVCRGPVTHFFFCVNGQRSIFDSKTMDAPWSNRMKPLGSDGWVWPVNLKKLADRGTDPGKIWIEVCREKGIVPWASVRMNDIHNPADLDFDYHSSFWLRHPEYWRDRNVAWDRGLNYSLKPVRDYFLAFIREVIDRYDVEGVELDWLRFPQFLAIGREREDAHLLTAFMREVRRHAEAASERRGQKMNIGVRVPVTLAAQRGYGLDVDVWAKEGLVDLIVLCNFYDTADFAIPYRKYAETIRKLNSSVRVVPGIDSGVMIDHQERRLLETSEYRGWAEALRAEGASDFYLFNVYENVPGTQTWNELLSSGLTQAFVDGGPRRYLLTHRDAAGGMPNGRILPLTLDAVKRFKIRIGNPPTSGDVSALIALDAPAGDTFQQTVKLNGVPAIRQTPAPVRDWVVGTKANAHLLPEGQRLTEHKNARVGYRYVFPLTALRAGINQIEMGPAAGGVKLQALALEVTPRQPVTEKPYAFRQRLEEVHRPNRRDASLVAAADEFVFRDGCRVNDADFADYLRTSMNVNASVGEDGVIATAIDAALKDREYVLDVDGHGVRIVAKDDRAVHQALYHLEDLMNLRRAPFLKFGRERRRMRFSPRMLHSGWGVDVFPDGHLAQMAHNGFDAILVFVKDIGKTQGEGTRADLPGLIRRARTHGLDTYLYTKIRAFVHPDDPAATETFDRTYGRLAATYRDAKGIVFVGESCEFPSKDERTTGKSVYEERPADDKRPDPGWYACRDYPQWMQAVRAAIRRANPDIEIVFWTYNWGATLSGTEAQRLEVLSQFPEDVILNFTFFKRGWVTHRNGLRNKCDDYTITFPGPSDFTRGEINFARKRGRRFYVMSNTGGLTWDFGCVPYEPFPHQWKRRWDALVATQDASALAGLMESHHYGWHPNFVAELAKEAFTEGGLPFDAHLRAIAARDFGERNADAVIAIWRDWSEAINDYPSTDPNQYGPFRIGPAYPFAFGGPPIAPSLGRVKAPKNAIPFPGPTNATHKTEWMCNLNYSGEFLDSALSGIACDPALEIPLLQGLAERFARGADCFERIGAARDATLGRYLQRTTQTAVNVKRGLRAHLAGNRAELLAVARDEYANAKATLPLLTADSRLGWEPSMDYAGGARQVRWKLQLMEEVYPELKTEN